MAVVNSTDWDHIDIKNGNDTNRHMLKDSGGRELIEELTENMDEGFGAVDEQLATKAEVDGYYDEMAVGSAEQLISTVGITDNAPYLFRTSGGSADIGDREEDKLIGGTVAWNQLIENGDM